MGVTPKQRMVLVGLRDVLSTQDGRPATVRQIAALTAGRWQGRPDLVATTLTALARDELVRAAPDGRYLLTPAGSLALTPRSGRPRSRVRSG